MTHKLEFGTDAEVAQWLRELAAEIETGRMETPDNCVVVMAGAGQVLTVWSFGADRDSETLISTLAKGQHCVMNAIMPYGSHE